MSVILNIFIKLFYIFIFRNKNISGFYILDFSYVWVFKILFLLIIFGLVGCVRLFSSYGYLVVTGSNKSNIIEIYSAKGLGYKKSKPNLDFFLMSYQADFDHDGFSNHNFQKSNLNKNIPANDSFYNSEIKQFKIKLKTGNYLIMADCSSAIIEISANKIKNINLVPHQFKLPEHKLFDDLKAINHQNSQFKIYCDRFLSSDSTSVFSQTINYPRTLYFIDSFQSDITININKTAIKKINLKKKQNYTTLSAVKINLDKNLLKNFNKIRYYIRSLDQSSDILSNFKPNSFVYLPDGIYEFSIGGSKKILTLFNKSVYELNPGYFVVNSAKNIKKYYLKEFANVTHNVFTLNLFYEKFTDHLKVVKDSYQIKNFAINTVYPLFEGSYKLNIAKTNHKKTLNIKSAKLTAVNINAVTVNTQKKTKQINFKSNHLIHNTFSDYKHDNKQSQRSIFDCFLSASDGTCLEDYYSSILHLYHPKSQKLLSSESIAVVSFYFDKLIDFELSSSKSMRYRLYASDNYPSVKTISLAQVRFIPNKKQNEHINTVLVRLKYHCNADEMFKCSQADQLYQSLDLDMQNTNYLVLLGGQYELSTIELLKNINEINGKVFFTKTEKTLKKFYVKPFTKNEINFDFYAKK